MTRLSWTVSLNIGNKQPILLAAQTASVAGQPHWYLDLEPISQPSGGETPLAIDLDDATLKPLAAKLLQGLAHADPRHATLLRLAFSGESGTIIRPDFLSYRLRGYEELSLVVGLLDPLSPVAATSPEQATRIIKTGADFTALLLHTAVGGVLATAANNSNNNPAADTTTAALRSRLDDEFAKRLSIPWTVPQRVTPKRVFWVQGRANIEASEQFYQAARALGITLVVLDEPGHWLEDDAGPHAHYREAFLPVRIDADDGLTQRVVDAVRAYPHPVHGVVCISDARLPPVARACEILGLPTSSSVAYARAGNKGATREIESAAAASAAARGDKQDDYDDDGFVVPSAQDLDAVLAARGPKKLRYPLIVKPCTGWNSDCVVKVRDEAELRAAVVRASQRHAASAAKNTGVVVEPYIAGPEVDANFIVLDGEVLFCDITDDFPCSGDDDTTSKAANFMETLMDVPSALPVDEQAMMRDALAASIARLGFQSGVFHCEARVRGSRAVYAVDPADGILDLREKTEAEAAAEAPAPPPSCFLHEVNARPPGYINCVAALLAHGVDYYAVRLLLSLLGPTTTTGDDEKEKENGNVAARVRALAQPFRGGRPQYTLGISVLAPTRAGIMASRDAVREFVEEAADPALRRQVVHWQTVKEQGDVVQGPDSGELWCVGYVIVATKEGRRECLRLDREVRRRFDYKLDLYSSRQLWA